MFDISKLSKIIPFAISTVVISSPLLLTESARAQDLPQLYGETAQVNQIRSSYLVFEAQEDNYVIGAVYQPRSEYTCFIGQKSDVSLMVNYLSPYGELTDRNSLIPLNELYRQDALSRGAQRALTGCQELTAELAALKSVAELKQHLQLVSQEVMN